MTTWHAILEWTADPGPDDTALAKQLEAALEDYQVGIVMPPDDEDARWSTSIAVEARTIRQASDEALSLITATTRSLGQHRVTIVALDVVDEAGFKRRMERPVIPPLVGYAGAAKIAGLTKQRAREIALGNPDHPRPAQDIEGYGPVYVEGMVKHFYAKPRKPGRRPKTEQDATT